MPIPIIDLFAGPGGLGEGFSSVLDRQAKRLFKIALSVEKDEHAYCTLELRAFFREFPHKKVPAEYYDYLRGKISRDELFKEFATEAAAAAQEAWLAELGHASTPASIVDERIRIGLGDAGKWALIGGPPCQAYSLVGRSRIIGREGLAEYEKDPRHELYRQYLRILAVHRPPVFVMENVKGLLSATLKQERTFERILADLKFPRAATGFGSKDELEYHFYPLISTTGELLGHFEPEDFIVRCEDFEIPQARHRIIILGIRSDWERKPGLLEKGKSKVSIEEVIGDLPHLRSSLSKEADSSELWRDAVKEITATAWSRNGEVTDDLREALFSAVRRVGANLNTGGRFVPSVRKPKRHSGWFRDLKLAGVCNHETRGHIRSDLHRYFFAAVYARERGRSPLLEHLPKPLLPDHKNVPKALEDTKFNDRFRVQMAGRPSTTIVSHIAKDGHYYIHYDPAQCRSLTVREAARLQTFPDNYFFEGPRTEQYHQVGNAVPPLLARQIAEIVADLLV